MVGEPPLARQEGEHAMTATAFDPEARWIRFLSRTALVAGLAFIALFVLFGVAMGQAIEVPDEVFELGVAAGSPLLYRLIAVADALVWLGIGATLLAFAFLLRPQAPVRAVVVGACGVGQVVGALGGFLRLYAGAPLGLRYAEAGGGERASLEAAASAAWGVIYGAFGAGAFLYKVAFIIIALVGLSLTGFPRWLAYFFLASGVLGLVLLVLDVAGVPTDVLGFVYLPVFVLALLLAVAGAFWRRSTLLGGGRRSVAHT
jgi:hypothetical protein